MTLIFADFCILRVHPKNPCNPRFPVLYQFVFCIDMYPCTMFFPIEPLNKSHEYYVVQRGLDG
jgi:hypothetical protein